MKNTEKLEELLYINIVQPIIGTNNMLVTIPYQRNITEFIDSIKDTKLYTNNNIIALRVEYTPLLKLDIIEQTIVVRVTEPIIRLLNIEFEEIKEYLTSHLLKYNDKTDLLILLDSGLSEHTFTIL